MSKVFASNIVKLFLILGMIVEFGLTIAPLRQSPAIGTDALSFFRPVNN